MSYQLESPPQQPQVPVPQSFVERSNLSPVVFAFLCLFAVFVSYQVVGGLLTLLIVGSRVTAENVMMHRIFTMGGQILFILVPTIVFARLLDLRYSNVFPWRMPSGGETIFAVLSLIFLQEVLEIYLFFQDRIPFPEEIRKVIEPMQKLIEEMFRILVSAKNVPELLFVVLVVGITPAVVEELLFRGLIQSSFERKMKPVRAAVWTGVIFGAFHFNPFAIIPLVILGAFFGILRLRSQSMVLAMTVHFLNNALAVVVSFFQMDDKMILGATKGEDVNMQAILTQLFLFAMLFIVTFSSYLRLTNERHSLPDGGA